MILFTATNAPLEAQSGGHSDGQMAGIAAMGKTTERRIFPGIFWL